MSGFLEMTPELQRALDEWPETGFDPSNEHAWAFRRLFSLGHLDAVGKRVEQA